jgi:putative endonuclease
MFWFVYVLYCPKTKKFYTGMTQNLDKRIRQHKRGEVHTTKRLGNPKLIFYEAFRDKKDAQRREKYLKTTKGKRTLKIMIRNYISSHRLVA